VFRGNPRRGPGRGRGDLPVRRRAGTAFDPWHAAGGGKSVKPILIVDYGMANLRSVQKAIEKVGHAAEISSDPNRVAESNKVVLPGVGAFRDAIVRLRDSGLAAPLIDHIHAGKPFLGICLGLQMLFSKSYEDGEHRGLDLFPGEVVRFPEMPDLKV